MSNILSPIVTRYSFFFTVAMFASSKISQTRQPTHLVQTLLIEAQQRYQEKANRKLSALIRNVSTSSSVSYISSTSSTIPSVSTASTALSSPSSMAATEPPSFLVQVPSFPPADDKGAGSAVQKSDEQLSDSATLVFTLPNQLLPSSSSPLPPFPAALPSSAATTSPMALAYFDIVDKSSDTHSLQQHGAKSVSIDGAATAHARQQPAQRSRVSKSSIATLLSVTLTMILLSLLQSKKRRLRKRARSLRATSSSSRRHQKSRHHPRDDYITGGIDRSSVSYPYSQKSSRTNTLTFMDGMTETVQSLTQSHRNSPSAGRADLGEDEPAQFQYLSANIDSSGRQSSPQRSPALSNFELYHRPSSDAMYNIYSAKNVVWSHSDGHLPAALSPTAPGTHSKNDFVTAWLSQQNIAASVSGDGEAFLDAKGYRLEHDSHHYHHYRLQQQQQQHPLYELPSYKPDGDHQHAIIGNSGVQREPRQEQPRTSIQSLNQDYHYPSSSRQSPTMMPLQHNLQHQQQELQQYSPHQQHRSPSSLPYGHDQHYYHPPPQNHFHQQEHQQQQYLYQSYSHQGQQRQAQAHGHHQYRVSPSMDEHLHPGQGHRRSLSLTHGQRVEQKAIVPVPPKFEDLTPAEQVRQELLLRRQRYQLHHQHLQQNRQYQQQQQQQYHHFHRHENQHLRALASHSHFRQIEHYGHIAGAGMGATSHGLGRYPSTSSRHPPPKGRSAHELAWERHCYYQQQQLEEEAVAEQRRKEQRQEQHGEGLVSPALDPTARTKSLSRITSLSLSAETVESLGNGLSRSKSVSMLFGRGCSNSKQSQDVKKNRQLTTGPPMNSGAAVKAPMSAVDSSTLTVNHRLTTKRSEPLKPQLSGKHQERPALDVKSENADDNDVPEQLETLQPVASTSLPSKRDSSSSLVRRSTLKSIGPSIRSLARRCSSRFSNSSRPNSFAGSNSDPIIQFSASDKAIAAGSLSAGTGNTALRHYTLEYEMINYSPPTSASTPILPTLTTPEPERVPIHRRVTLFRSKSLRVALASESSNDNDNNNTVTTSFPATPADATTTSTTTLGAMSLSSRLRDSLRLANGRGLNFTALQTKSLLDTAAATTTSTTPLDNSDIELSASTQDKASLATLIHASPSTSEEEQYEVTRRQIIALLASGRKERISVKTGQAMASSSSHHLSPLAVEAQENLLTPSPGEQEQADEEDPCERIAFMLVPKSRYEFQPLVMV